MIKMGMYNCRNDFTNMPSASLIGYTGGAWGILLVFRLENYVLQIYSGGSDNVNYGTKVFMRAGGNVNTTSKWTNWSIVAELGASS